MGRPPEGLRLDFSPQEGKCNVVAYIQMFVPGSIIATSKCCGTVFHTDIQIPKGVNRVTIFGGLLEFRGDEKWIRGSAETSVVSHSAWNFEQPVLLETCAGIGAIDRGHQHCGIQQVVYNDNNQRFCKWLESNGKQVVQGDICESTVVAQLAQHHPMIVSGGVSCQPFSELGDKREQHDDRSRSFTGVLQASYETQAPIIILECTPAVYRSEWAQDVLKQFAAKTNFRVQQTIQELHKLWPAKRTRWWCVITHPKIDMAPITNPPPICFQPTLLHLFRRCIHIDPETMQELELGLYETRIFHTMSGGIRKHAVDFMKPLPTATHSWGSQLSGCECGCRDKGFSMERLESRGLYGQVIPLPHTKTSGNDTIQALRYLHPSEVALANCLPGNHVGTKGLLKLELAGVGQMASPLQGLWLLSQVFQHMGKTVTILQVDPIECMKKLVKEVFDTRDALMPPSGSTSYMKLFEEAWEQYGQTTFPQQVTLFETDNGETEKVESFSRFPSKEKSVNPPKVNPTVAPGSVEDASWDGRVGEPGKTQRQAFALVKEASEGLDELDRCILASDKQIVTFPQHPSSDQRVNCTEAFKRGAVPGFEAVPKKRPKIEEHVAASKKEDIDDKKTKGEEGKESSALLSNNDPVIEEQFPEQLQGDDSFQVIEVYLVGDQSAIEKIVAPKGTTCSQLIGAESRLQNKKTVQITDAVGQIIPKTQRIEHGSILRCITTQDKTEEKPDLRHDKRDILLWQQKGWTASDEMDFYRLKVDEIAKGSTYRGLILMDSPATATDFSFWVLQIAESLQHNVEKTASFVLWNQHWVPIGIAHNNEGMEITTTPEAVGLFQGWAQHAWQDEANDIQWKTISCAHAFQNDCGFQTIAWIQAYVQNTAVTFVNGFEASQQRAAFHRHLEETSLAQEFVWCPLTLGGMMNTDEKLAQLLQDHGVAKTRCTECAANLMQSLGKSVIQQVLTSAKPWADLKARASMVRPPIRIVLADELQATIDR